MYNTPPCWCIYMTGLVLKVAGGTTSAAWRNMQKSNEDKAAVLYDYLDESQDFYNSPVRARVTAARMNVTFTQPATRTWTSKFCAGGRGGRSLST